MADERLDAVYSSDLARARETAQVLAKIAPPLPEPTAEELASTRGRNSSETVAMRGNSSTV
jgi:broad specificity phosphatase PhoE